MKKIYIKRFFECYIPVTICNLRCDYCYVIQRGYRNMQYAKLNYSVKQIVNSLNTVRLGGTCFFSICGGGETLVQNEVIYIAKGLLDNGHIVNITTNGTLTKQFKKFKSFSKEELERLHFSFSLHYLELKKNNLLNAFFNNVKFVKALGCSFVVQINLYDGYMPYIDEIINVCNTEIGAPPQVAATRQESSGLSNVKLFTNHSKEEYIKAGRKFNSNLFDFTIENFGVKRTEFCNAGVRSGVLDLSTGALRKCYGDPNPQYIFNDPRKKIKFEPIGNNCLSSYCFNSSHFMSLGVIDNSDKRTYCNLRDRPEANWFNETTRFALSNKLSSENNVYSYIEKKLITIRSFIKIIFGKVKNKIIKV